MKKSLKSRLVALTCVLLMVVALLPVGAGATTVEKYGKYGSWLYGYEEMALQVTYTITGPGDYRIDRSRVWAYDGRHHWTSSMIIYLYIYSDYPIAHWFEKLGELQSYETKLLYGNVPRWWYFNRAGYDIGVAYVQWNIYGPYIWNVQVQLP